MNINDNKEVEAHLKKKISGIRIDARDNVFALQDELNHYVKEDEQDIKKIFEISYSAFLEANVQKEVAILHFVICKHLL